MGKWKSEEVVRLGAEELIAFEVLHEELYCYSPWNGL